MRAVAAVLWLTVAVAVGCLPLEPETLPDRVADCVARTVDGRDLSASELDTVMDLCHRLETS